MSDRPEASPYGALIRDACEFLFGLVAREMTLMVSEIGVLDPLM